MTDDEIAAMYQRLTDAFNADDCSAIAEFYAEDAILHDGGGDTAHGREEIAARARRVKGAYTEFRTQIVSILANGNRYAIEWKASAVNGGSLSADTPATNKSVVYEGCDVVELGEDGLIRCETEYMDHASIMRQLGVLPEPPVRTPTQPTPAVR